MCVYLHSFVVVDAFKTAFVGLEDLIPHLQTVLVCIGLRLHPGDEHAGSLVRAPSNIEPPLPVAVSLHVHFVDTIAGLTSPLLLSPLLLEGGGQPVYLHQLVELARVARLHVRVADGNQQLSLLVSAEHQTEALYERLDVPPAVVVGQSAVENTAFSLRQVPVYRLAQITQLRGVRIVLTNTGHDGRGVARSLVALAKALFLVS